jgi:small subunit ribosomal protein S8
MVNDTISDMLTRIRNANNAKHHLVQIPSTKTTLNISKILKEEGFVEDFECLKNDVEDSILISLKYSGKERKPIITKLERISKPGLRIYTNSKNMPSILGNLGISIISTSQGLMTNINAKALKIGGEVLCTIY